MTFLFWSCVLLIGWAYVGYPASMYAYSALFHKLFIPNGQYHPPVTVIIAAANESFKIKRKLLNTINQDYVNEDLEIIVTLDGPTDDTEAVVRSFIANYPEHDIKLIVNEKGGKESAQLAAIRQATWSICIFTDAATTLSPNTVKTIVRWFDNPRIGAVDGMSKVKSDGHSSEGIYLKYENKIREFESNTCGLVTLGGCLFAARTEVLLRDRPIPGFVPGFSSDLRTALVMRTYGFQSIIDTDAIASFQDAPESKEFSRKHRTIVRGINNLFHNTHLLNPFKYGLFSYALFCHKLLKWLVPFFMIGALIANAVIVSSHWFYVITLLIQLLAYIIVIYDEYSKIGKLIRFLVVSNLAVLKAWWSYIRGERFVSWIPTQRQV